MLKRWNDENPITLEVFGPPTAHAKGFIAVDPKTETGFYFLHSFVIFSFFFFFIYNLKN